MRPGCITAQQRTLAAGLHGGQPAALAREAWVPDGVHGAVDAMQMAPLHPPANLIFTESALQQLLEREHAVGIGRPLGDG